MKLIQIPPKKYGFYILLTATLAVTAGVMGLAPLYTTFFWWDIVAHVLSGAVIALVLNVIASDRQTMAGVLFCAIVWEIIEVHIGAPFLLIGNIDTITDIIYGLLGGILTILITDK